MEYRNKATGQIISVSASIEGGLWEPVEEETEEPVEEETEEPVEEAQKKAPVRKTTRTKK